MIPILYSEKVLVVGPSGDTEVTVNVHFTVPLSALPEPMGRVVEQEIHNAVTRIMGRARLEKEVL